ncbi:glycosyltransferase family 2 protein [Stratiformator vulcanicus]|uniref:Undecaprenyl-phosphate mannosyltransferase n=1 Tax=Stratiformator vulcanicus TaxID=2527980 RepID=A0A517QVT1_9PLAN|nr:glycosyltransferase family 2 protein [Stratiformator vulcanicus]QDT35762.1 Undecaprenyl-phosphate mannosyltransferase [Stratiformator vulcanicus]
MKLVIQIPCYNEAETLPATLADLPRRLDGIDEILILIIDDGSWDCTSEVARAHGVDHIVRHTRNRGLARSFSTGLDASLGLGADIIVNTDGDNQYRGSCVKDLIKPILKGEADFVIGDRQTQTIEHFAPMKKWLQRWGSFAVRQLSNTEAPDAVSGFRALSREAALNINIVSSFSYTIETVIQAGSKRFAVKSVPIEINPKTRQSRLFRSIPEFLGRSAATLIRMYAMYHPLRIYWSLGLALGIAGSLPILRFLYFYAIGEGGGRIQSLVLGGTSLVLSFLMFMIGLVADLIASNRRLVEMCLTRLREMEVKMDDVQLRSNLDQKSEIIGSANVDINADEALNAAQERT